jgi:hypothetical protein
LRNSGENQAGLFAVCRFFAVIQSDEGRRARCQ